MQIIAYIYDADVSCPDCASHDASAGILRRVPPLYDLVDRQGNPVHPVFSTDEHEFTHCADCGAEL